MKIIRFIFSSLLALSLIAGTVLFIFFQTFDTDQFLPQIAQRASLVLGRPVTVGAVWLGFSKRGITLNVGPVTVGDDPGITTQPFIKIDEIRFSVDLRSLILRRELHISKILLQAPRIHFIRSMEGDFNTRNLGQATRTAWSNRVVKNADGSVIAGRGIPLEVQPQTSSEAAPVNVVHLKARPFPIMMKFIKIRDGAISFIDQDQTFLLDIWLNDINANLGDFSLSKPFRLSFDASLFRDLPNVHGSALISLPGDLTKRSVRFTDLKLGLDLSRIDPDWLKSISPEMPDNPVFNKISGVLQLNMDHLEIDGSGNITADGDINITDGVIKDFNIVKIVLSHTLGVFGGMEVNIDNLLGGHLQSKLGARDTIIKKAWVRFSLHDKTFFIDDCRIETNILDLNGHGSIEQGLNVEMQTMLYLNDDTSAALIKELQGFKYLLDDSKRIAISASLKGKIPHLKYKPDKDFRKKSKKALMEEGGNILGVLLGGMK